MPLIVASGIELRGLDPQALDPQSLSTHIREHIFATITELSVYGY
ncbi:hypothetical protein [Streptomyces sp. ISL-96]|nr:hypothetical protein [Streptomyces sp. ISL-96]